MFTIRVYGICLDAVMGVLVSDEFVDDFYFTKFPGGGMEFGEGTVECLKRELREEMGIDVEILSHFYTTDFFQVSAFDQRKQVVAIYYLVKPLGNANLKFATSRFGFSESQKALRKGEIFRWISLDDLSVFDMTFQIDQVVVGMLKAR